MWHRAEPLETPRMILAFIHFRLSRNRVHLRVFSRFRMGTARRFLSDIRLRCS